MRSIFYPEENSRKTEQGKKNTNLISKTHVLSEKESISYCMRESPMGPHVALVATDQHTRTRASLPPGFVSPQSRNERRRQARPRPTVRSHTHTHTHTHDHALSPTRIHGTGSNGRRRGKQRRRRAWERRGGGERGRRAGAGSDVAAGAEGRAGGGGARAAALLHRAPRAQARRRRLTVLVVSCNPVLLPSRRPIRTSHCSSKWCCSLGCTGCGSHGGTEMGAWLKFADSS